MAAKGKKEKRPRGVFEIEIEFTDRATGDVTRHVSTPSMWGRAQEYMDSFIITSAEPHSESWLVDQQFNLIALMAAEDARIMPRGPLELTRTWELFNLYDVHPALDEDEAEVDGEDEENPTEGGKA